MKEIFEELDITILSPDYQNYIEQWAEWYRGSVKDFHSYNEWNGQKNIKRERFTLGMAKKACEDWADTLYNPETYITVDERRQNELDEYLQNEYFTAKINELIDRAYGVGTGAVIATDINNQVELSYVSAEMLKPVIVQDKSAWLVMSEVDDETIYLSIHFAEEDEKFVRHNHIVIKDGDEYMLLSEEQIINLYGIEPVVENTYSDIAIIKPSLANNVEYGTEYGMSIYANAISELKGVDLAYTSLLTEVDYGKMKTFAMVGTLDTADGKPKFKADTGEYYVMEGDTTFEDGTLIKTQSPTLRTDAFIDTLSTNLNLVGRKCGFGDNSYSFEDGTIYTNTAQVISTNSKFYKTRQKHLEVIEDALKTIVRAILSKDSDYNGDISIDFDDSIITDTEAIKEQALKEYNLGLISKVEYFMETRDLTEELAREFVAKQQADLVDMPDEDGGIE